MKHMTLDEALLLHNFIVEKTARVEHLERMINMARASYKHMTPAQLNEAVRDIAGMRKEIEAHKAWIKEAQKMIDDYFKCPTAA